jgi:hypothetical protein
VRWETVRFFAIESLIGGVMKQSTWLDLGIVVIVSSACGGSVTDPGGGGSTTGAGGQGGTGQGSTAQATTGQATSGQGGSGQAGSGQAGSGQGGSGQAGSGQGGSGQGGSNACGARLGDTCGRAEYCDFPYDLCGAADGTGVCRPMPLACDLIYMPTCGCDGKVHGNECEATLARVDVSNLGCPPPAGSFSCASRLCTIKEEYCESIGSDIGDKPTYLCKPIPPNCRIAPTCACVLANVSGGLCDTDAAGNVTISYPGG